ncbi:unnamed protein product [Trichobilharzia regenti]|nr:unnamed protein product [Trichobilharzia regenti]
MTHERRQTLCLIQMFLRDVIEEEEEEVEQQQQQRLHQQQNQQKQDSKQSIVHLQEFSSNDWALDKASSPFLLLLLLVFTASIHANLLF